MRHRNELTKAILEALQTPNRTLSGTPATIGNTKIARNTVFKSAAQVLTASGNLVGEYVRLDKHIADMRDTQSEGVAEAWADDVENTARLLNIGAATAIRTVRKMLGADTNDEGMEDRGDESVTMEALDRMELNYELQKSLHYAERGVKNMVKSLPYDEGH